MCLYAKYNFLFFILIVIMTQTCSRCITHFMIYILIMMTDLTGPTPGRKWPQCDQSWLNTHPRGDQCQWCVSYDSNLQQKRPSVHKWIIPSLLLLVVVQYLIRKKKKKTDVLGISNSEPNKSVCFSSSFINNSPTGLVILIIKSLSRPLSSSSFFRSVVKAMRFLHDQAHTRGIEGQWLLLGLFSHSQTYAISII